MTMYIKIALTTNEHIGENDTSYNCRRLCKVGLSSITVGEA